MIKVTIFAQDPQAFKRWLSLEKVIPLPCFSLQDLANAPHHDDPEKIILAHLTDPSMLVDIKALIQQQYKIIIFSNTPSPEEGARLFKIGVKGYLNTFSTLDKIQHAIESVNAGQAWLGQNVLSAMIQSIPIAKDQTDSWKTRLSKKEIQTMLEILKGKTNRQIAEKMNIKEGSVKSKVTHLFEKLDAKDRLDLVLKVQNWRQET
jgi:DNA-binding NarL/FixJ family response regulator